MREIGEEEARVFIDFPARGQSRVELEKGGKRENIMSGNKGGDKTERCGGKGRRRRGEGR